MLDVESQPIPTTNLNGNPLGELRVSAVRAVLGAPVAAANGEGSPQDHRRLAMIRAEWFDVAAEIGLPASDVSCWIWDELALRQLVEAFDARTETRQHGWLLVR
jgi:hypothetical protein